MNTLYRGAKTSDFHEIFSLVYELATFERAPEQVSNTAEMMLNDWENGTFDTIVAESDGRIIGMALFHVAYSTWKGKMMYLEDLIVTESFRGQGIGDELLKHFLQTAIEANCKLVKWQVLDWNTPAVDFYLKKGASVEKNWWNVKILLSSQSTFSGQ